MTVVALGETMIRLSPPRGDLLVDAHGLDLMIGGAEANVAVALAALGVSARWLGALPRNPLGERVASSLAAAGVDVSRVVWRDEGRVGLYFVEEGVSPRPARVLYDRAQSAMTTMTADELPDDALEEPATPSCRGSRRRFARPAPRLRGRFSRGPPGPAAGASWTSTIAFGSGAPPRRPTC